MTKLTNGTSEMLCSKKLSLEKVTILKWPLRYTMIATERAKSKFNHLLGGKPGGSAN